MVDPQTPSATERSGLAGDAAFLVITEYGDDFWQQPFEAGFGSVQIVALNYPSTFALICRR